MFRRSLFRFCVLVASFVLFANFAGSHAQDSRMRKYKAPPPSARIQVTVLKADNGKPIQDAHVIFHPIEGDKDKGSMELKTDADGQISIDVIPVGDTVRLQVIANGFQTYGDDYKVDHSKLSWEVCLRRPGPQYSIYTNHPTSLGASTCPDNISHQKSGESLGSGSAADTGKSSSSPENAVPPPASDKPSSSASQSNPSQPQSN